MPLFPALRKQRQMSDLCEFQISLSTEEIQDRFQSYTKEPCLEKLKREERKRKKKKIWSRTLLDKGKRPRRRVIYHHIR